MRFDEQLHTPSALTSELEDVYRREPEALLFGSLGRAIILGEILGDPAAEFKARRETPIRKIEYGEIMARDIDVVAPDDTVMDLAPFEIDRHAFGSRQARFVCDNGDWYLVSDSKGVYEPLHPAVMEPIEAEGIFGVPGRTVSLQTHQHLFGLKGALRPKDQNNLAFLSSHADKTERLPDELYEPFIKLSHLANTGWFNSTRRAYRAVVPEPIRYKFAPFMDKIKNKLA